MITKESYSIDGTVYNKITGKRLGKLELSKLIQEYPNIVFEKVINKYGKVEKRLFDPNNIKTGKYKSRTLKNQTKVGEEFPEFVFKTIKNKSIESKKLKGWVVLRFGLFAKMMNNNKLSELNSQIETLSSDYSVTSILCLADTKENIDKVVDLKKTEFQFVANGDKFHQKFNIIKFPTTIILDPNGKVVKYFYGIDRVNIKELIVE